MSLTTSIKASSSSRDLLHPYQERAVQFILDHPRSGLFLSMGLGKTIATLTAINDLTKGCEISKVLVVAPLRVALNTWPAELGRWDHVAGLTYSVLAGRSAPDRLRALSGDEDIHVINRENVAWLVEKLGDDWPYDMVVLDESSSFKSHKSQRWKALRKVQTNIHRMVLLTGTPAPNGLLDLWAQIALLDRGQRLGRTYQQYQMRYFESDFMGYKWTIKEGAADIIHEAVADLCLSMQAADYLELPPVVHNTVAVDLPDDSSKRYRQLEKDFLIELEQTEILAFDAAARTNKLLQAANGAIYDEDGAAHELHKAKLDALEEILEANPGQPILCAYNYKSDLTRICKRFKATVLDKRPATVDAWNRGEIPLLVAHPASCGHGLNLQGGGNILVWFGLNWSLELYQQMCARLYRQGQTKPTIIHHIVAKDTIDETVLSVLDDKEKTQNDLLLAVRDAAVERV